MNTKTSNFSKDSGRKEYEEAIQNMRTPLQLKKKSISNLQNFITIQPYLYNSTNNSPYGSKPQTSKVALSRDETASVDHDKKVRRSIVLSNFKTYEQKLDFMND